MKRKLLNRTLLKQTALAVPAAALMLGSSQGAEIGINFQDDYTGYASYSGKPVTATAFGIDPTNWFNMVPIPVDAPSATNQSLALFTGASLSVSWKAQNAWVSGIDSTSGTNVPPGFDEVIWGYLDDTSPGWTVTISGLRSVASSFTLQLISASDSTTGFGNINVLTNHVLADSLNFTNDPSQFIPVGGAGWGTSTVSIVFATLGGNDSVTLQGVGRNGTIRNTLAGILLNYSSPASNPPLIESNPQAPTNLVFTGQSFSLGAAASGSLPLSYQWRYNTAPIPGATGTTFSKSGVTTNDSGNYDVVVTNTFGSVTSQVAAVTVSPVAQPQITQGPLSQTFYPGYPASFTVQATGGQLSYQWKKGASTLTGQTNATLTLPSISTNDAATYTITVTNPVGTASASATLTVVLPGAPYPAVVARQLPQVYYRFSETGPLPYDLAANSGSLGSTGAGMYLGGTTHPTGGALAGSTDTAAGFDGASGRVAVPYSASLNPGTFTAEAWLNPGVALTGSTLTCPLSCGDFGSTRAGWLIYQSATGWNLRTYDQNAGTVAVSITGGPAPVAGTWYHVAAVFDGTTATLYVNGTAVVSSPPTNYVAGTAGPLAVGCRADTTFFWHGVADEVAFYSTPLSSAQILAHYQNGTNAARVTAYNTLITGDGAVEYLRLDEPKFFGNTRNLGTAGVLWNGTESFTGSTDGQPGPQPPAYPGFESTNTAVQLNTGSVQAPALSLATNTVTMVAWLNLNGDNTAYYPGIIFTRPSATGLGLNNADILAYNWNNDAGTYGFGSGLAVPPNQWVLTALVVTPTNATLYLGTTNGLQSAVNTHAHAVHDFSTAPLVMGFDNGNYLNGEIDEAALYPYALTADQISALFAQGTGVPLILGLIPGGIILDTKPAGTPHNGLNYGALWQASSGPDANSVTRTGVEQFVATNGTQITVPADPDFNSPTGTICFWMRYNIPLSGLPGPGNEAAMLFDRRTTAGTVIGINTSGAIEFQAAGGANAFAGGYVVDGNWHHVAVTYDQSVSGSVSLFIDGVLAVSNPNTTNWAWPTTQEIELGRSHDPYWKRFDGQLDDFRIYNQVLAGAAITTIGTPATSDTLVNTAALELRFNFDTPGAGHTLTWPFGSLQSSPVLGPGAVWTAVPGASSPYPILPTAPHLFYRLAL
ncbi:MAG TPA: LamG-like jellyroll fold domain-containing protein [Candidatus Binatia bacterium]|jgi:hypothetical protein|nr:LamG-like jellyroll fold domain-containing protein [Candidatus Binatia bacterium]